MGLGWMSDWHIAACTALLVACSSARQPSARDVADANDTGRSLKAADESEREIIRQLPLLPDGIEVRARDISVVGDRAYAAASGRTCRLLHLTQRTSGKTRQRLACATGDTWFFVPDVLGRDEEEE
jgi:hypothetical protein